MYYEVERIEKAKEVLGMLAGGMNPFSGELMENNNLMNDARTVRCFYFVTELLDDILKGNYHGKNKNTAFIITPEQKSSVVLPEEKIGVNEFSRCINACINLSESKRLTGIELNKKLKKLGILSNELTEEGRNRTVLNESSPQYGFETERRSYNGVEYDKIVLNSIGKKYLLENLEIIMAEE